MPTDRTSLIPALNNIATRLRIHSIRSTSESGTGHPTSCCSVADLVAALFFAEMRFDPKDPRHPESDRFVLSKGHAAPILYAAWAEAGLFDCADLLKLRTIGSDLEGHPTPRLSFVDVATGSLGQGICAAIGTALNARRIASDYRTYVLLGDGETAEGSVWEAADVAAMDSLDNLCGITDVNGIGQSRATMWRHDMEQFARRWRAFGWHPIVVDGHDLSAILDALAEARRTKGQPTMILARTVKGKGVSFAEGKDGWHGRAFKKGEEMDRAVAELEKQFVPAPSGVPSLVSRIPKPASPREVAAPKPVAPPAYTLGDLVATREAYGTAIAKLGTADSRVVALDADVKNSTFSDRFEKVAPERFYQNFIAEQVMVGAAMGLAARGAIPFPSTFACFLSRAADFIRMAAISNVNIKLAGSHAGVSIGEDGPSQMALEDLAMCRAEPNYAVLYPCDAVSTERLVALMAYHPGPAYMRTSRPKTPVIYANDEVFTIGGLKVICESANDVATVVGAGITVFEALKAYEELKAAGRSVRVIDLYSVAPVDRAGLIAAAKATLGRLITVEDHYSAGGIGDAVSEAVADAGFTVHRLAVREIPRSGKSDELVERFGISARHIVEAVNLLNPG
ncbi:MAG: transketolase [Nitrospirae bacterium RIFCSPLOWO2_12_FULL_63_8]|nr:MAG: transketolase [Nitrospirae bacterium RIFCSPLOWO2_12_FULL_63_8]